MAAPSNRQSSVMLCLIVLSFLAPVSSAQNVPTWHNDINRTGWQSVETILTPSTVSQTNFGLLWQWGSPANPLVGYVFAQPLAVAGVQTTFTNCQPCDLVFVATERDMLYAFKATSNSTSPIWSKDLAQAVGGTAVDCSLYPNYKICKPTPSGELKVGPYVGVTGTPVIDPGPGANANTLYVAETAVVAGTIGYYLLAVDITSGTVKASTAISGSVPGGVASSCSTATGTIVTFGIDSNHIQRSGLLLLNNVVYVAFGPLPEIENGWMFGYSLSGSSFSSPIVFNTTPHGTGGGVWESGAAPASDGSSIFVATANGTFDLSNATPLSNDAGDSLLKLNPSNLAILDYYTPYDVFTYGGTGLCLNDVDFGSGGVMVFPDAFYHDNNHNNNPNLLVNGDKQSNLYVTNRDNLGGFNAGGGNNIQLITTPPIPPTDPGQGYWASPAYWHYRDNQNHDHYMLYHSATTEDSSQAPKSLNAYPLLTSGSTGPIPSDDNQRLKTSTLFCKRSPTPSVSSNGTAAGSGIVWAIEHGNADNPNDCEGNKLQAVLHAFDATTLATLYNSRSLSQGTTGDFTAFSTPTIFKGRVYMGTHQGVTVFGLCTSCPH